MINENIKVESCRTAKVMYKVYKMFQCDSQNPIGFERQSRKIKIILIAFLNSVQKLTTLIKPDLWTSVFNMRRGSDCDNDEDNYS